MEILDRMYLWFYSILGTNMENEVIVLHKKKIIEDFFRNDTYNNIYQIGDLDDSHWSKTIWFGLKNNDEIKSIILLYIGHPIPSLLALSHEKECLNTLLSSILTLLPQKFYAHLSLGLETVFQQMFSLKFNGNHLKMALKKKILALKYDAFDVVSLGTKDLNEILDLYKNSYPENWFSRHMLASNQYFGIKERNRILSIAGIHVYSNEYNVAAIGNITTHPNYRRKGYGKRVVAKLCQSLMKKVDHIGLVVKSDNIAAISTYEKLGFEVIDTYNEFLIERIIHLR